MKQKGKKSKKTALKTSIGKVVKGRRLYLSSCSRSASSDRTMEKKKLG